MADSANRFGSTFTLAGTTVTTSGGTQTLVAAPGAGTTLHLGTLIVGGEAAGGWKALIQDSAGNEIATLEGANRTSIPLTLPANGLWLSAANRGLQLVNVSGVGGTIGAFGTYRLHH